MVVDLSKVKSAAEAADEVTDEADNPVQWPMPIYPMPMTWSVESNLSESGIPMVCIAVYTTSGAQFCSLTSEDAKKFASQVRKCAENPPPAPEVDA